MFQLRVSAKRIVFTAMFAAIIFVGTRISIPAPFGNGYIHLGDSFVYLCATLLPLPYCAVSALIGATFSDVLSGYMIYVPATAVIKFAMACCFRGGHEKILTSKSTVAAIIAGAVNVIGYFVYECIIYGVAGAWASVASNIIQSVGSAVLFIIIAVTLDRTGFKKIFSNL